MSAPHQVALQPRTLAPGALGGPLVRPEPGEAPHVWLVRVAAHRGSLGDALTLFDEDERSRHAAFHRAEDRDRYAAAHVALRRLLGAYLGTAPGAVAVEREPCPLCGGPHGRPAVSGSGLHFSLSHSGELVLLAFAATPVGIDVEETHDLAAIEDVSTSLHPREQSELAATAHSGRAAAFLRCWTRKEAYLKGTGEGLPGDPARTYVGTGEMPAAVHGWTLADIPVDAGHAAAVAVRRGQLP
ncbi:4'-phosphopantetheinyl transferase superfamily protein [Streptomyces sp. RB6PN25]|uniref:4'-phosphopantetheinyl transferase superfamily protein n=1 Tax=Streptomyces humicola TaxID=2953240 RepID=A0ABT1Q4L4_9ACTN|nr:4'-phosphopantetheinyl transferase superfamily protein [Streptomyces humicola]MCQ4083720.1 4'-phosphopantetheinyl transferase superfamily protein [Streptomyces humicola]